MLDSSCGNGHNNDVHYASCAYMLAVGVNLATFQVVKYRSHISQGILQVTIINFLVPSQYFACRLVNMGNKRRKRTRTGSQRSVADISTASVSTRHFASMCRRDPITSICTTKPWYSRVRIHCPSTDRHARNRIGRCNYFNPTFAGNVIMCGTVAWGSRQFRVSVDVDFDMLCSRFRNDLSISWSSSTASAETVRYSRKNKVCNIIPRATKKRNISLLPLQQRLLPVLQKYERRDYACSRDI